MRNRDGAPDAHDNLIDRPRSLMPAPKQPKLTVNGAELGQPPRCKSLIDHEEYLRRESDPDRIVKENTARYLLDELNKRAEFFGRELALARAVTLVQIDRKQPGATGAPIEDWRREMRELYDLLGTPRAYNEALRMIWFRHNEADRNELKRIQKNLADAAV